MIAPVQTARGSESWRSNADLAAKSMWIVDVFNTDLNPSRGMLCITCGSSIHPLWTSTPSKFIPPSFKFKQLGMAVVVAHPPPSLTLTSGTEQKNRLLWSSKEMPPGTITGATRHLRRFQPFWRWNGNNHGHQPLLCGGCIQSHCAHHEIQLKPSSHGAWETLQKSSPVHQIGAGTQSIGCITGCDSPSTTGLNP